MATQQVNKISKGAQVLESRGISRRKFLGYCAGIATMIGLSQTAAPQIAEALESVIGNSEGNLKPVIWLEGASCTGCTEAFAQVDTPDVPSVVLELLSLNYSETLSAAAGHSMEEARKQTIAAGGYLVVYEGAVVEGWDGNALRIADEKGTDILLETAYSAEAVIAYGSCACDGGWQAARPNPSGALGVQKFLKKNGIDTPVINIPCCPGNPEWIVAVLVEYLLMGRIPELNNNNEPKLMFNETVHDNCPRRGHFENGEFVYNFGSIEEEKGYCLYALGCKGPQTFANCPIVKSNRHVSWCVEAGAPCVGCGVISPMNANGNWVDENTPFLARHRYFQILDWKVSPAAICGTVLGLVVGIIVVHAVGMKITKRTADQLYEQLDADGVIERHANHKK